MRSHRMYRMQPIFACLRGRMSNLLKRSINYIAPVVLVVSVSISTQKVICAHGCTSIDGTAIKNYNFAYSIPNFYGNSITSLPVIFFLVLSELSSLFMILHRQFMSDMIAICDWKNVQSFDEDWSAFNALCHCIKTF